MTKKEKTKKKSEAKPKAKDDLKQDSVAPREIYDEVENRYGGIPDRDLKKNLGGCG